MCNVTLPQAKQSQLRIYNRFMALAQQNKTRRVDLEDGLARVSGLQVKVYEVPREEFKGIRPDGTPVQPNAFPAKRYGRYIVFLADRIRRDSDWPAALAGDLEKRFVVLHEYRHILEKDVFEDNPELAFNRRCGLDPNYSEKDAEDRADGYAAHRMVCEAARNAALVTGLQGFIKKRGLPNP
jgi:hypothetical protein